MKFKQTHLTLEIAQRDAKKRALTSILTSLHTSLANIKSRAATFYQTFLTDRLPAVFLVW